MVYHLVLPNLKVSTVALNSNPFPNTAGTAIDTDEMAGIIIEKDFMVYDIIDMNLRVNLCCNCTVLYCKFYNTV